MDEEQQGRNEIFWAVAITVGIIALGGFGVYYFFAPPPPLTIEEAAAQIQREKEQKLQAVVTAQQEAEFNTVCGEGLSGGLCRLRRGACDTALGGYLCFVEGRETGDL